MINLLPQQARARVAWEYRRRLAAVVLLVACVLCLIALALVVSGYLSVWVERSAAQKAEDLVTATLADPTLTAAQKDIAATGALLSAVEKKSSTVRPSVVVELLLAARPPGTAVRQISYVADSKGVSVTLSGTAATRAQLLAYRNALSAVPGVSKADFPPENLAASTTVDFTMSVKYTPPVPGGASS